MTERTSRCVPLSRGRRGIIVDLLYGGYEGGQRTITRFGVTSWPGREGLARGGHPLLERRSGGPAVNYAAQRRVHAAS